MTIEQPEPSPAQPDPTAALPHAPDGEPAVDGPPAPRAASEIEAERVREAEAGVARAQQDPGELARIVEALLFLSPEAVPVERLAEATGADEALLGEAIALLDHRYAPGVSGLQLKRVSGGLLLATDPISEPAARALLSTQRVPPLTAAQAETLAIVAYLQPVARPEISRIRGVAADSATATLLERGLIEEAGRSDFGAVLYRTTTLFLRLFGLDSLAALPDVATWDPSPEEADDLRDRLLRAGGARAGTPDGGPAVELPEPRELSLDGESGSAD